MTATQTIEATAGTTPTQTGLEALPAAFGRTEAIGGAERYNPTTLARYILTQAREIVITQDPDKPGKRFTDFQDCCVYPERVTGGGIRILAQEYMVDTGVGLLATITDFAGNDQPVNPRAEGEGTQDKDSPQEKAKRATVAVVGALRWAAQTLLEQERASTEGKPNTVVAPFDPEITLYARDLYGRLLDAGVVSGASVHDRCVAIASVLGNDSLAMSANQPAPSSN